MKNSLLILLLSILIGSLALIGCAESSFHGSEAKLSQAATDGGADGSGGFTGVSTVDQVAEAHKKAKVKFTFAMTRMQTLLKYSQVSQTALPWNERKVSLLEQVLNGNEITQSPFITFFNEEIQWVSKDQQACESSDGKHVDGAAKPAKTICISFYNLTRFAAEELEARLIQLYAHELAHLYFGDDEETAKEFDSLFSEITTLVFPDQDKVDFVTRSLLELQKYIDDFQARKFSYSCDQGRLIWSNDTSEKILTDLFALKNELFFSAELTALLHPATELVQKIKKNGSGYKLTCENSPDLLFDIDENQKPDANFLKALDYWKSFYSFENSKSEPVDVQTN